MNEYIPGICNIGKIEMEDRKKSAIASLSISVVAFITMLLLGAPSIFRLILFIPVFGGMLGLLQYYFHFCAAFALKGVFNFSEKLKQTETVSDKAFRRKDQLMALKIFFLSFVFSSIITFILLLI